VTTWKEHILHCQTYRPHCHCWASNGEVIYAGCMDGEVLSFDVNKPYPKHDTTEDKAHIWVECQLLLVIGQHEQVADLCLGQNHMVVIGANGSCYWLGFPIRVKKIKPVEVASKKKGKKKKAQEMEIVVDEFEPIDPNDFQIVDEIHLAIGVVTSAQYRKDEKQLLLGSFNNIITTIKVDDVSIQTHVATKAKRSETSDRLVEVMWQSSFHNGPILAISTIKLVFNLYFVICLQHFNLHFNIHIKCKVFKSIIYFLLKLFMKNLKSNKYYDD
jgi:hypothetical protein